MNGTLPDLFGVIAASTGLLGAAVIGTFVFLLYRAAVSSALAILPSGAAVNGALALFLPHRATCVVCAKHLVRRFPKRNDIRERIMLTDGGFLLPHAEVSSALAILLPHAEVSGALAISPSGAAVNGALALFLPHRAACGVCANHLVGRCPKRNDVKEYIMSTREKSLLIRAAGSDALAISPSGAACGVCENHFVKQFSKRNDDEKHIMLTDEDSKGGENAP